MNRFENSKSYESVYIKTEKEIDLIEKACRIVAETLTLIEKKIVPGVSTLELDKIAEDFILSKGAKPAFKGYKIEKKVFPYTLCISIDEVVVHGMPGNRKLVEGEIVSIDCGACKEGYFGDSAITVAVGKISELKQRLMKITNESLFLGLAQAITGNKVYDISREIQTFVENNGFSLTRELVGHGIGKKLHEDPPIPNFVPPLLSRKNYPNLKLMRGMALAIEPMVHAGTHKVKNLDDGWTVKTADSSPAAHFEHTVIVDNSKPVILTLRD
ncbi:MAG: type I methionyl aminopeptidase [Candidatus Kapabacteria bacterium]|nr:type I methionyl aminopeptidase [Candidatus Kapabacteria bacterium]